MPFQDPVVQAEIQRQVAAQVEARFQTIDRVQTVQPNLAPQVAMSNLGPQILQPTAFQGFRQSAPQVVQQRGQQRLQLAQPSDPNNISINQVLYSLQQALGSGSNAPPQPTWTWNP